MTAADLRGRHDLTSILGYSWRIYLAHFRTLFVLALIVLPVELLATIIVRRIGDGETAQAVDTWLQVSVVLVTFVAAAAIITAINEVTYGRVPDAGAALDRGIQKFWPVVTTQLLAVGLLLASLLAAPLLALYWWSRRGATIDGRRDWYLALVPGALTVFLFVRWSFGPTAVVLEDTRNWAALDGSAAAVRGQWWRTFGILLVIGTFGVAVFLVTSPSALAPALVDGLITGFATALTLPFVTAAQTLLYYDLKARNQIEPSLAPVTAAEPDVPREGP